jgi:pimeloyl-ACP methyl ester carboxylesterase
MSLEVKTHYSSKKIGTPDIIFVHGAWHAAWCWEENFMPFFAEHGFTSHALSLRGHGGSFGRAFLASTRIKNYVDDLVSLINSLETSPIIVGHSMGGFIVQKYLESHKATAVVLLASLSHHGILGLNFRIFIHCPFLYMRIHIKRSLSEVLVSKNPIRDSFFSKSLDKTRRAKYFKLMSDESYAALWDMSIRDLPKRSFSKVPMLALGAEHDWIVRPNQIRKTAEIYDADFLIIPDISHEMMLDTNWRIVAEEILKWLTNIDLQR